MTITARLKAARLDNAPPLPTVGGMRAQRTFLIKESELNELLDDHTALETEINDTLDAILACQNHVDFLSLRKTIEALHSTAPADGRGEHAPYIQHIDEFIADATPIEPPTEAREDEVKVGPGIYIASKTTHGDRWRKLRASGVPIISTWIDEAEQGATSNWPDLWHRCVREAAQAAVTIVYREEGEVLKGAFVEMGAALASGHTVLAVGCDEFSIRHHMRVVPCSSLEEALDLAREHIALTASQADAGALRSEWERERDLSDALYASLLTARGREEKLRNALSEIASMTPNALRTSRRATSLAVKTLSEVPVHV